EYCLLARPELRPDFVCGELDGLGADHAVHAVQRLVERTRVNPPGEWRPVRPFNEKTDGTRQRSRPRPTRWRAASGSGRAPAEREGLERAWGLRERAVRRAELAQPRPEPRWRPAPAERERGFRAACAQPRVVAEVRGQRAAPQAWGRPGADPRETARRSGAISMRRVRAADRQRRAPHARAPAAPDPRAAGRKSRDRLRSHPRSPRWRR